MDHDYALAFALANRALCLFVGAGFSKHLTNNAMPDWRELLESSCEALTRSKETKNQLAEMASYPLEDRAQILELAFLREGKDLRKWIAERIARYKPSQPHSERVQQFLCKYPYLPVLTTNYDKLVESLVTNVSCNCHYPGKPIDHRDSVVNVYHIHGCIDNPDGMVVTSSDYYKFINTPTYFGQKVTTLMHENTTVILGYSLSDPNLKAILNAHRTSTMRTINRANLFYVTQSELPTYIRDYYEAAYGIVTLDKTKIDDFLECIEGCYAEAKDQLQNAERNLKEVLAGDANWPDDYLKSNNDALFHIFATANTYGFDVRSDQFRGMLQTILTKKVEFSKKLWAWEQYSHLAEWLVFIGSIIDIKDTLLQDEYLGAVQHSMTTMSSDYTLGRAWHAFQVWKSKWVNLTFRNRMMVREFVSKKLAHSMDASEVVQQ